MTYRHSLQDIGRPNSRPLDIALAAPDTRPRPAVIHTAQGTYRLWGKRALDLILVAMLILPVAAVCLLLASLIALDGANPVFGHRRVGRNGRTFRCWKLRTMVPDAETRLTAHLSANPAAAAEWAASRKLSQDPRITWIGRFLRRSSLDELPQVWNVLRGDMSLVGPRPVTEDELLRYGPDKAAYLSVSPGITGPWQVLGRNDLSYPERVAIDRSYAAHLSLRNDLLTLFRTVPAILKLTGR